MRSLLFSKNICKQNANAIKKESIKYITIYLYNCYMINDHNPSDRWFTPERKEYRHFDREGGYLVKLTGDMTWQYFDRNLFSVLSRKQLPPSPDCGCSG